MPPILHRIELNHGYLQRALGGLVALPARAFRIVLRGHDHRRQTRHASELDDYLLRDIGLARPDWNRPIGPDFRCEPHSKPGI